MTDWRLDVTHLSKTFGPARVLRDVHLQIAPGELHGLVGQNGCGKSTLVKLLSGVYTPDPGGSVKVDGQTFSLPIRPIDQRRAGVSVVHQNMGLVDDHSVWENVRVGRFRPGRMTRRIKRADEKSAAADVLARLGRSFDVDALVGTLSAEDRATVAIARAVQDHSPGGGLVIFDESTRALTRDARIRFFELVRSILDDGAAVLLISHQLEEIVEVTDRLTVLRDGAVVASGVQTSETDEAGITRMMLGRHIVNHGRTDTHAQESVAASVRGLVNGESGEISFDVKHGEIIGLTGLVGSGYADVGEIVGGARKADAGMLVTPGKTLDLGRRGDSPADFIAAGVGFVPEQRLEQGLAGELSVAHNVTLPRVAVRGSALRIGADWQLDEARRMIEKLDIRPPDPTALVGTLSGGNQQKVLLAKWLAGSPHLLVLSEPTQAVDVGARQDIIAALRSAAADGCAVVVASVDAGDLAVLCDRVLIFQHGRVTAELTGDLNPDTIIDATFEKGLVA